MAVIPALILAAVDYFVTRRNPKQVAQDFNVAEKDLAAAYSRTRVHTWAAKLAAALSDPNHRPDLLVLKRHLACFEQQFEDLMVQYQYARQTCDHVRSFKLVDSNLLLKADTLAFRIHQSASRILRDIQKTELRLEKAEKTPLTTTVETPPVEAAPRCERSTQSVPAKTESESLGSAERVPSEEATSTIETEPAQTSVEHSETSPPAPEENQPATNQPSPEEFRNCIIKHRHRIKNTPAKDRPTLIFKLLEQERAKKSPSQTRAA